VKTPFAVNKVLGHLPILSAYLEGKPYAPILVEIDLTNLCASACPWCAGYLDRKRSNATLFASGDTAAERFASSMMGVSTLLEELKAAGVKAITWTGGGDPAQHRGLAELVGTAAELGLKQALITNGVHDVSGVIHHLEWVRFSVDGATQEGYGNQHGKPEHFERVLAHVRSAAERKRDENLGVTVGVGFLTHKGSWHEIIPFAQLWPGVPIDYIQYRPLEDTHGQTWASDEPGVLCLIQDAVEEDNRVVYSVAKYRAIGDRQPGQTEFCHGIYLETAIAADGFVYTCCHHKGDKRYAIGDLNKETFNEIWTRHMENRCFEVTSDCPRFCRHYGTNRFIEDEILAERTHPEFI